MYVLWDAVNKCMCMCICVCVFIRRGESKREFTDELRGILEVSAMTGLYW